MKAKLATSLFFLVLAITLSNSIVKGADEGTDLNLTSFPRALADKLSISEFAGGILASMILMMAFILPTAIFSGKNIIPAMFVGILCLGASIAFGWLDHWFLIIMAMIIAFMFAGKMRGFIGGGEKG